MNDEQTPNNPPTNTPPQSEPPPPNISSPGVPQQPQVFSPGVQPVTTPGNMSTGQVQLDASPSSHKKQLFISLIIILLLLLAGGAAAFFVRHNNNKNVTSTKVETGTAKTPGADVSITAPITKTENCGTEDCFSKKFTACSPATLDASSAFGVGVYYEIYGPKSSGCSMLFKYTQNPNPDWVNKDLTCTFDNKKSLRDAVSAAISSLTTYSCTGPLVAILQGP